MILFPYQLLCPCFQHVICTGLWCKVEGEKECRTKLDPPMDGTDCDTGKVSHWCCLELIRIWFPPASYMCVHLNTSGIFSVYIKMLAFHLFSSLTFHIFYIYGYFVNISAIIFIIVDYENVESQIDLCIALPKRRIHFFFLLFIAIVRNNNHK